MRRFLPGLALFLIVAGVRLWLVAYGATATPMADPWDAEGVALYKPWLEGNLRFAHIVHPHTESRMVPSKLLALGAFALNRQWDARFQAAINAILVALMTVVMAAAGSNMLGEKYRIPVTIALGAWGALPFAWENTIWAFQSSFYFLVFFSLTAIWGLALHRAGSIRWFVGLVAAVLAMVSMASGIAAVVAILALQTLRLIGRRYSARHLLPTFLVGAALLALAAFFWVQVPEHKPFRAASLLVWLQVAGHFLSWPFRISYGWLLAYLPAFVLLLRYLKNRSTQDGHFSRQVEMLLGIVAWVVLQAGGIAYARGAEGAGMTPSRYTDILALGLVANFVSIFVLAREAHLVPSPRLIVKASALWAGIIFFALALLIEKELKRLGTRAELYRAGEEAVRACVATGDKRYLPQAPRPGVPYPEAERLATFLDDATLRKILPASVRPPLQIVPAADSARVFAPNEQTWTSDPAIVGTASGSMKSEILHTTLPYLRIDVFGRLRAGMSLFVEEEGSGAPGRFRILQKRRDGWRTGYIRVPGERVRLIARDENPNEAFAFRAPVEVGRWSYYTERILPAASTVLALGLALALALVTKNFLASTKHRP